MCAGAPRKVGADETDVLFRGMGFGSRRLISCRKQGGMWAHSAVHYSRSESHVWQEGESPLFSEQGQSAVKEVPGRQLSLSPVPNPGSVG